MQVSCAHTEHCMRHQNQSRTDIRLMFAVRCSASVVSYSNVRKLSCLAGNRDSFQFMSGQGELAVPSVLTWLPGMIIATHSSCRYSNEWPNVSNGAPHGPEHLLDLSLQAGNDRTMPKPTARRDLDRNVFASQSPCSRSDYTCPGQSKLGDGKHPRQPQSSSSEHRYALCNT